MLAETERRHGPQRLSELQSKGRDVMHKTVAAVAAAAALSMGLAFTSAPASAGAVAAPLAAGAKLDAGSSLVEQVGRRRGRRIARGAAIVGLGILGAAAIVGAAKAARRDRHHRRRRYHDRCEAWLYRCEERGNRRACYKFDRYC